MGVPREERSREQADDMDGDHVAHPAQQRPVEIGQPHVGIRLRPPARHTGGGRRSEHQNDREERVRRDDSEAQGNRLRDGVARRPRDQRLPHRCDRQDGQAADDRLDDQLSAAAEMFADERSNAALVTLLREQFQVQDIADEHHVFGRVPWRRVYTTNYDDVVELAHRSAGRAIVSLTAEDDVSYVSSEQAQWIHVNGYIGTLTEERLFADFRLTDSSYATTAFASSQWAQQMRHDFAVARVVVFVGYSLQDLDIQRLLRATHAQRDKTVFYVGPEPSRVLSHRLSKFGTVVGLNAATLAEVIAAEISDYTPAEPVPMLGRVVVRRMVESTARAPQDRDIASLFLWGAANHDFIWGSVAETNTWRYVCYRDQLDQTLQLLEDGARNVVVRSDLGNGKSIFLDSLDCLASVSQKTLVSG